jgi:hypothetical protein
VVTIVSVSEARAYSLSTPDRCWQRHWVARRRGRRVCWSGHGMHGGLRRELHCTCCCAKGNGGIGQEVVTSLPVRKVLKTRGLDCRCCCSKTLMHVHVPFRSYWRQTHLAQGVYCTCAAPGSRRVGRAWPDHVRSVTWGPLTTDPPVRSVTHRRILRTVHSKM